MIFSRKSSTWGVCYLAGGLVVTAPVSFCLKPRNEGFDGSCQSSMRNFFHSSQYYFIYLKRSDRGPKGQGSETFLFFRHLLLFFSIFLFIRGIFLREIFFEGILFWFARLFKICYLLYLLSIFMHYQDFDCF